MKSENMKYILVKCRNCGAVFVDALEYIEEDECFCPFCQAHIRLADISDLDKRNRGR